ncbi:MAG: DUF3793 family protein [Clostridia bacterium]|nr:DUF3793 family protein [Clostridia bacterium]
MDAGKYRRVSEEKLLKHCSPTLAGLKTGSMFNLTGCREGLNSYMRSLNERLSVKGVRVIPLKFSDESALVYVYRPKRLEKDLKDDCTAKILVGLGYDVKSVPKCLACLIKRMRAEQNFPHEVGLFLSYPPEDVKGFIENGGECFKCCGCWKVYGDVSLSERTFCKYKRCTDVYVKCYREGIELEKLTVREIAK